MRLAAPWTCFRIMLPKFKLLATISVAYGL